MKLPLRAITVTGCNLTDERNVTEQISLFDAPDEKREKTEKLEKTLDNLRQRFGKDIIK